MAMLQLITYVCNSLCCSYYYNVPLLCIAALVEAQIFYQKMKADYYRYLSEVYVNGERKSKSSPF